MIDSKYVQMIGRQDFYYVSSCVDPFQKQPPEGFCRKKVFLNCEIHRKTLLLVSVFYKNLQSLQTQVFSREIFDTFKKTFFEEHLQIIAFVFPRINKIWSERRPLTFPEASFSV